MKTIFLDFDGVLFDSAKESYILARAVFDGISPFDEIDTKDYAKYIKHRYMVANSWQYYYLMLLLRDESIKNSEEFEKKYLQYTTNRNFRADNVFDMKFQSLRKTLINDHYDFWRKLETPFPFFYEIKKLDNPDKIFIVSTKNKEAIIKKCKEYDFNLVSDNIVGKEILKNYTSKRDFLQKIIEEKGVKEAVFVEDNENNLNLCKGLDNLKLCLAGWGYVSPEANGMNENEIMSVIKGE